MTRAIVRAWNKDGYHRDIALLSERQVHSTENRVSEGGMKHIGVLPIGWRVVINPKDFPEMVEFEVIIPVD